MSKEYTFLVKGSNDEHDRLQRAISLLMNDKTIAGWTIDPRLGFVLFWYVQKNQCQSFPAPISPLLITPIVILWLESKDTDSRFYNVIKNPYEGGDGTHAKGWIVQSELWHRVELIAKNIDSTYTSGAVTPNWEYYGK